MNNPRVNPARVLGLTKMDYAARRAEIVAFLDSNEHLQQIPEAEIRAALTVAVNDRIWNQLKADIGLF